MWGMWTIRVGMREMRCECGCRESAWEYGEYGWKYKNMGNHGADAGNQGGNLV